MASYVDVLGGLNDTTAYKAPCRVATTTSLNGAFTGLIVVDGITLAINDRILVWQETNPALNGIYNANTGAWTRAIDFSSNSSILEGTQVYVSEGLSLAKSIFVCQESNPSIGTTPITFTLTPTGGSGGTFAFRKIVSGTTDTAQAADGIIAWDVTSGGAKSENIPAASNVGAGHSLTIKDDFGDANINNITVTPASGTVDGQAAFVMGIRSQSITLISDGVSNWIIV